MSPTILDPSQFSAGAAQTQGWPYDPTRNSTTTATPNGHYQPTMQAGYSYPQAAEPSYYTQTSVPSSSYQEYNGYHPNTQPYQQTGPSYESASAGWPQPADYEPSVRPSLSSSSTHQHAAAIASTSATQSASSKTRTDSSKPTASTSRRKKNVDPDMTSKMNRFRVTDLASTVPAADPDPLTYRPGSSTAGEKRKERSPTPDAIRAEAPPEKEAKRKEAGRVRSQKGRDRLNSHIADLAERLPDHLLAPGEMSSKKNIVQAARYIDEQHAEIKRLKEEAAQLRASEASYKQRVYQLGVENVGFQMRNKVLQDESEYYQGRLIEMEARIRDLEGELQKWPSTYVRDSDH